MASGSKKVIYAALAGNSLIAVTKFVAAAVTGSSAMLSEGIHSLVDTGNQVLLLRGLRRAKRSPDTLYPFGHGKALLLELYRCDLDLRGRCRCFLLRGSPARNPSTADRSSVGQLRGFRAMLFEGFAWLLAWREFTERKGRKGYVRAVREGKDPTLFVVLFEDSAAMAGLVVAFFGVFLTQTTGILYFDGAASIVIGVILGGTAVWLAYETNGLLIGESANPEVVNRIRELAQDTAEIEHVNEVLTMHMGP